MTNDAGQLRLFLLVLLSAVLAILLSLIPLPSWLIWWWPRWMVLVVIFWSYVLPQRVGLGSAWLLGLLMDLTQGTLIGEQALALTILSFLVILLHGTLQMLTKWQRTAVVLLLVLAYQLILLFIQRIVGKMPFSWFYLLPAFTSALCWPLVSAFLSAMQRRWRLVDTSMRNIYTRL